MRTHTASVKLNDTQYKKFKYILINPSDGPSRGPGGFRVQSSHEVAQVSLTHPPIPVLKVLQNWVWRCGGNGGVVQGTVIIDLDLTGSAIDQHTPHYHHHLMLHIFNNSPKIPLERNAGGILILILAQFNNINS